MKITVNFEKIVKSPHFLHLTSINWLDLQIRLCSRDVEHSGHKGQNSRDDNLCKSTSEHLSKIPVE